jgi:Sulfotransferase family
MGVNPYVFIVGCPRSGTTLLRRMVDAHPQVAITRETHWIPEWFKRRTGITPQGLVTGDLIPTLLAYPKFRNLGIDAEQLERLLDANGSLSYSDFVSAVFDLYGQQRGKQLVGDKTPGYVREIGTLHDLWPQARVVHLIRDGRDVCLSALAWERKAEQFRRRFETWAEDPVTTAMLWWRWHVLLGREEGIRLGPGLYFELRYEALVRDPEAECRKLCEFLGVPYEEAMLRYHEGRTRNRPGLPAKHAWLPPTPGLRDWRTQMPADALERAEAAAGDVLDELGYERGVTEVRTGRLGHAARIAALFAADAPAGGAALPEGW